MCISHGEQDIRIIFNKYSHLPLVKVPKSSAQSMSVEDMRKALISAVKIWAKARRRKM